MESDIAATGSFKTQVLRRLQEMATPEQRIVRVRVTEVLGTILKDANDVNEAVERLKQYLLKLLAEGSRIVLE
jgi:hypothetical protein